MRSTQLSESFNRSLRAYLKFDLDIVQFYKHFKRSVDDKRANESKSNFNMTQRISMLKILDTLNVKDKIPNYYIVKRWKKDATNLMAMEIKDSTEGSDPKAEVLGYKNILPWQSSKFTQVYLMEVYLNS
ncbi:hypothetical protein P3S67_000966 [Capsicum chacoense]